MAVLRIFGVQGAGFSFAKQAGGLPRIQNFRDEDPEPLHKGY